MKTPGRRAKGARADALPSAAESAEMPDESLPAASDEAPATSQKVDFPCSNCGAKMTWDPEHDALACEYCGTQMPVPRGEGTIVERALEDAGAALRGLGTEMRAARCANCGARVCFSSSSTAESCVYCGSANVLAQEANRNALRPESLVPLDLSKRQVEERFRGWVRSLWFRPTALKQAKHFHAVGIYVPFWTFDCRVHSQWSADAGHYYYVTVPKMVMVNGKMKMRMVRERRIRWVPAFGRRDDAYDDELVCASGIAPGLVNGLGGFDTKALVPYRPDYLAGWRAEEYQLDLEQGWARAQTAIVAVQRDRCAGDVPGDTHRNLHVQNRIDGVRWKHVLLPVWSLQYRFRGKVYTVLVNGQNGCVSGKAPISWVKVVLFVLAMVALVLAAIAVLGASGALR
jgi:DNA-directed RNA polymerase subunit RPC12/RpoP